MYCASSIDDKGISTIDVSCAEGWSSASNGSDMGREGFHECVTIGSGICCQLQRL